MPHYGAVADDVNIILIMGVLKIDAKRHGEIAGAELTSHVAEINMTLFATYYDGIADTTMSLPQDALKSSFDPAYGIFGDRPFSFLELPVMFRLNCHEIALVVK
jgi:hypothetical protein